MSNANTVYFKYLPMSTRVLFSMVLLVFGLAYCMAMIQVWVTPRRPGRQGLPHGQRPDDFL